MARRFRALIGSLSSSRMAVVGWLAIPVVMFSAAVAFGAPTPSPSPVTPPPPLTVVPAQQIPMARLSPTPHVSPTPGKISVTDQWTEASRIFDQLSQDQRGKFLDNLNQWKAMSPEEQELFRDRDLLRREKIAGEIQDAITKAGLKLDDDQREMFALRYTQERRKIEEALRKDMDNKRQIMISDLLSRLRTDFASTPPPVVIPKDSPQH